MLSYTYTNHWRFQRDGQNDCAKMRGRDSGNGVRRVPDIRPDAASLPQHEGNPCEVSTHLKEPPIVMLEYSAETALPGGFTSTINSDSKEPLPGTAPRQKALPSGVIPHTFVSFTEIELNVRLPSTSAGEVIASGFGEDRISRPQQYSFPAVDNPHVTTREAAICLTVRPPVTRTGDGTNSRPTVVDPLPSWPHSFCPQHHAAPSASRPH